MTIKGDARPIPVKVRIRKILKLEVVKAKVSAVPSSGAEQGVDNMVARIPLEKSFKGPFLN